MSRNLKRLEMLRRATMHRTCELLASPQSIDDKRFRYKNCSIGCLAEDIDPSFARYLSGRQDHKSIAEAFGVVADYYELPEWLLRVHHKIYSELEESQSYSWHVNFAQTLNEFSNFDWKVFRRIFVERILQQIGIHTASVFETQHAELLDPVNTLEQFFKTYKRGIYHDDKQSTNQIAAEGARWRLRASIGEAFVKEHPKATSDEKQTSVGGLIMALSITEMDEIISNCSYKEGWKINFHGEGERPYIQISVTDQSAIKCSETGEPIPWKTGKRYLSPHMCRQEVVGTVFGLIKDAEMHETHEWFRYKNSSIYNPHLDPDALAEIARYKRNFNVRENAMSMNEAS